MDLLPGIEADGCAVYLREAKTLVVSDLHIGYESEVRSHGVQLPQRQREYFAKELDRLVAKHKPERVILAGDVKHAFGAISKEEWDDVGELLKRLQAHGCAVEVVGGNHDKLLKPILDKYGVPLRSALVIDAAVAAEREARSRAGAEKVLVVVPSRTDVLLRTRTRKSVPRQPEPASGGRSPQGKMLIIHGDATIDELLTTKAIDEKILTTITTIICGHEHPAITISDGVRSETVKAFLVGEYRRGRKRFRMVVLPSFNPLAYGTDVLRERPLGPLLTAFGGFSAFAVLDGKVLAFGRVERLQRLQRA